MGQLFDSGQLARKKACLKKTERQPAGLLAEKLHPTLVWRGVFFPPPALSMQERTELGRGGRRGGRRTELAMRVGAFSTNRWLGQGAQTGSPSPSLLAGLLLAQAVDANTEVRQGTFNIWGAFLCKGELRNDFTRSHAHTQVSTYVLFQFSGCQLLVLPSSFLERGLATKFY